MYIKSLIRRKLTFYMCFLTTDLSLFCPTHIQSSPCNCDALKIKFPCHYISKPHEKLTRTVIYATNLQYKSPANKYHVCKRYLCTSKPGLLLDVYQMSNPSLETINCVDYEIITNV